MPLCRVNLVYAGKKRHHVRFTTRSVRTSNAPLASLSGKFCNVSRALSAYAHASSLVRSTPDDRRTRSRAWTCPHVSQRRRQQIQSTYELDVTLLLELSSDEGAHLGVFFPCVQRWASRQSQL